MLNVDGKNGSTVATAASTEFWLTLPPPAFPSCLDGPNHRHSNSEIEKASFVSDEFNGGRRSLLDLLIDVKLVQLESVIMVCRV